MNGTYIKLYRKMTDWEWYDDTNCVRIFLHFLLKANWEDSEYKGRKIPRGSLVIGREALSKQLGISERGIRTTIKRLVKCHAIDHQATNQFSVVSVCNFDTYNPQKDSNDQQLTSKRPATDQQVTGQVTTSKEDKNIKREESKNTPKHRVENLEIRLIRLLSPNARREELNKMEASSLSKVKRPLEEHDMELLEYFFALDKSKDYDQTWKRKQSLVTILNNLEDQLDLAYEHKQIESKKHAPLTPKHIIYK